MLKQPFDTVDSGEPRSHGGSLLSRRRRKLKTPLGTMAAKRQSKDDDAQPIKAGGGVAQGIVELVSATRCGLVFWSRHPFEIAAELQVRVHCQALPGGSEITKEDGDRWVQKRGFVVECRPARRTDGSVGFQVSLLFESVVADAARCKEPPCLPLLQGKRASSLWSGRLYGLN